MSSLREVRAGTQGKSMEAGTEAKAMEEHSPACSIMVIAPRCALVNLCYSIQDTFPGVSMPAVSLTIPQKSSIKNIPD